MRGEPRQVRDQTHQHVHRYPRLHTRKYAVHTTFGTWYGGVVVVATALSADRREWACKAELSEMQERYELVWNELLQQ